MTSRPWKRKVELEAALGRGELDYAIALVEELEVEHWVPLETAS
jgi:hypothetical protein